MNTIRIRAGVTVMVAAFVLAGVTACTTTSDVDRTTACLDDLGVDYSIEDGGAVVILTQYAGERSEESRARAWECLDSAGDSD